jgi:phospho-N-acetylmuramoyl-pentapeptide-transferase
MITQLVNPETNGVMALLSFLYLLASGGITLTLLLAMRNRMPADQGRAFAVNGELSKGKARGVGLLFVLGYVIATVLFVPITWELSVLLLLLLACMMTGFLDDAGTVPWGGLKKGLLDLGISVGAGFAAWHFYGTTVHFPMFSLFADDVKSIDLPAPIYIVIAAAIVWGSINVVNCTDGVDGLCASLSIIALMGFVLLERGDNNRIALGMIFALLPYLWFNASPSSMLMGDAGSRALGFLLAMLALRSTCMLAYLPLCTVFILDGGLGLLKLALLRSVKIHILKNTRTPLHDHARKKLMWGDAQTVFRFCILQSGIIFLYLTLIR